MRARHELHKLAAGGRLYNFGGDEEQSTTSTNQNYDQRQVYTYNTTNNDLSDNSTTYNDLSDRSTTYNDLSDHSTTFNDLSDHSVNLWDSSTHIDSHAVTNIDSSNRSVTNIDSSDRSTNNTYLDNSNRSVTNIDSSNRSVNNTTNNYLDNGAIAGGLKVATDAVAATAQAVASALGFASKVADQQAADTAHAYDYADSLFHASLDAVNQNDARALAAFDRAAKMENDALAMSQDAAKNALSQVQNAYADAKGTTQAQQKIMLGVLAVAAVAVLAPRLGK
jgi:hypothetical protein